MQQALLDASRKAGMAEMATGILHNIGNALNSAMISAHAAASVVKQSKSSTLERISDRAATPQELIELLQTAPHADMYCRLLRGVSDALRSEQGALTEEINRVRGTLEHICAMVADQQRLAKGVWLSEDVEVKELLTEAVSMSQHVARIGREAVRITCDPGCQVNLDRHGVLQILVNLVDNAAQAIQEVDARHKEIRISADITAEALEICVSDNGVGMTQATLERLFTHGFSTKVSGHGFGLHNSALLAKRHDGSGFRPGGHRCDSQVASDAQERRACAHPRR
jgi:signal transduction histidine kinase